jgi:hypothetical protein
LEYLVRDSRGYRLGLVGLLGQEVGNILAFGGWRGKSKTEGSMPLVAAVEST